MSARVDISRYLPYRPSIRHSPSDPPTAESPARPRQWSCPFTVRPLGAATSLVSRIVEQISIPTNNSGRAAPPGIRYISSFRCLRTASLSLHVSRRSRYTASNIQSRFIVPNTFRYLPAYFLVASVLSYFRMKTSIFGEDLFSERPPVSRPRFAILIGNRTQRWNKMALTRYGYYFFVYDFYYSIHILIRSSFLFLSFLLLV